MKQIVAPGTLRLAVLASGRGSNFDAICEAILRHDLDAEICLVISDKEKAPVLQKAAQRGIPNMFISPAWFSNREDYEQEIVKHISASKVDLVVLAGYMRLIGKVFLQTFKSKIVNIHPALLPSFTGLHAQRQAVDYGVRYSGCTVHFVDEGMDTGPIILQSVVPVYQDDNEDSLSERILKEEHNTYWQALQLIAEGKVFIEGRKVYIKNQD